MSLRDMFSKSKIKRSRTPSNPSESNRSFVNNMKSRVSGLVPQRISRWFSSSAPKSTGNGSPVADSSDSSEDEPEVVPPPAKRTRYNSEGSQYNQCQLEPTPYRENDSGMLNNHNVLYTSIQPASGRDAFMRESSCTSSLCMYNVDESNMEADSLDNTDREDMYTVPSLASSLGQSVSARRKSIFERAPKAKPSEKTTTSPVQSGCLPSEVRPRFRPSLYGSPFYPGPTMYGGASASTYIKHPKTIKVRESNNTFSELSSSTRRIIDLLENCSSPLEEARRIPVIHKRNQTLEEDSSPLPSTSKSSPYRTQQLNVPSIASILRLKTHSRRMDTNRIARQIIASHSSTLPGFTTRHPYSAESLKSASNWAIEKEGRPKLKMHTTRANREEDPLTMPEPVQLPTAVLHIDKHNLPRFSITSPTSSPSVFGISSTQPAFTSNCKTQVASDTNTGSGSYTNSSLSKSPTLWSDSSMFKFANPVASPVAISQELQITDKIMSGMEDTQTTEETLRVNETEVTDEPQHNTNNVESQDITSTFKSSNGWSCSDCWVNNKADVVKCVCCGGKRLSDGNKPTLKPVPVSAANAMEDENNGSSGVNCEKEHAPTTAPPPALEVKKPEENWTCENCWIKNKMSVKKCAACGGSKTGQEPAAAPPAPHAKYPEEEWKCDHCWINNKSSVNKCAACGGSKIDGKDLAESVPQPQFQSPFSKPPDGKLQENVQAQKNKWECLICLIRNEPNKTNCQCCGMEREGPSKEITPKPFTFPKESNINFKFGIDPKEQENNIAQTADHGTKSGLMILEPNNNKTYMKCSPFPNSEKDEPKVQFTFGIPKTTPQISSTPAVVPSHGQPKENTKLNLAQETVTHGAGFFSPPRLEQAAPPKTFPSFVSSTPIPSAAPQPSIKAPVAAPRASTNAPNNEMKEANNPFRFADVSADKPKTYSFGGEPRGSTAATTTFSFGVPNSTTVASSAQLFSNPQPQAGGVASEPPSGSMFADSEPPGAPGLSTSTATPLFGASATPTPAFSFGTANNNDKKVSPFGSGFKTGGASAFTMSAAAPMSSDGAGGMPSSMSNLNKSGSGAGASTSTFGASVQESAWGAKGDAKFGPSAGGPAAPFTFGGQFAGAGSSTGASSLFGAQLTAGAQNVFSMPSASAPSPFETSSPAQPATLFGTQPAPAMFGGHSQPSAFGAPAALQQPSFGIPTPSQPPSFGMPAQSQPPAFGAPPQSQPPSFGAPAQSQPPSFGAPAQSQPSGFGVPAQSQSTSFCAPAPIQPAAFGGPAQPTAAPGSSFNFGSSIFSFGQQQAQQQQPQQQQSQPQSLYSFGSGNAMGGMSTNLGGEMMTQPMDGGMGGGTVHFNVGSAPTAAGSVRRVRKAVRRNQPR